MNKLKHWIRTASGLPIDPLAPTPDAIEIGDIAHALSHQCRFAGHVAVFYSVAQHCVHVATLLRDRGYPRRVQLAGLLHDASEAYLTDIPTPIKVRLPEYKAAEDRLQAVIMEKFGLAFEHGNEAVHRAIKAADLTMLAMEARDLHGDPQDWESLTGVKRERWTVHAISPTVAREQFRARFEFLSRLADSEPANEGT